MFDLGDISNPAGQAAAPPGTVGGMAAPDPNAAARAKMMSGMLRQGAQQKPQGTMAGDIYVPPSFAAQLAPAASAAGYGYLQGQ
jgi:hypothetical protein